MSATKKQRIEEAVRECLTGIRERDDPDVKIAVFADRLRLKGWREMDVRLFDRIARRTIEEVAGIAGLPGM